MAEEARFFLRTAVYSAVISVIYWFSSYDQHTDTYDWAGTVMLAATALAATAVVTVLLGTVRRARSGVEGSPLNVVSHVIGFAEPGGAADERPLTAGLEPVPSGSAWPVAAGVAATMIALGLVFGPWLVLPGIALLAATVWGWITE